MYVVFNFGCLRTTLTFVHVEIVKRFVVLRGSDWKTVLSAGDDKRYRTISGPFYARAKPHDGEQGPEATSILDGMLDCQMKGTWYPAPWLREIWGTLDGSWGS